MLAMTIGDRIRHARKLRGLTQEQLAKAVKVSRPSVSQWESNTTAPSDESYSALEAALEVSEMWIRRGTGHPPIETNDFPPDRDGDIQRVPHLDEAPPEWDDGTPRIGNGKRVHIRQGFIPEFDLRAGASYGGGFALQRQVVEGSQTFDADVVKAEWGIPASFLQGELRLHPLKTDVIAVDGPSMIPDLMPGDRVLIDRSHTDPRQGGIFAVREDDGIIIKHVEIVRGSDPLRIVCKSSNQTYTPFELVLDGERVAIIGRVAGRISRM